MPIFVYYTDYRHSGSVLSICPRVAVPNARILASGDCNSYWTNKIQHRKCAFPFCLILSFSVCLSPLGILWCLYVVTLPCSCSKVCTRNDNLNSVCRRNHGQRFYNKKTEKTYRVGGRERRIAALRHVFRETFSIPTARKYVCATLSSLPCRPVCPG